MVKPEPARSGGSKPRTARPRTPKPITPQYLRRAALYYLRRHTATVAQLRRVMTRKVRRSMAHHGGDAAQAAIWVEELIGQLQEAGLLDDVLYASLKARSLTRRGDSFRKVRSKLAQKGVDEGLVKRSLQMLEEEDADAELLAACRYARRRGFGPYRREESASWERRRKELGAMMRAGFPPDLCRRVVEAGERDDLPDV